MRSFLENTKVKERPATGKGPGTSAGAPGMGAGADEGVGSSDVPVKVIRTVEPSPLENWLEDEYGHVPGAGVKSALAPLHDPDAVGPLLKLYQPMAAPAGVLFFTESNCNLP